MSQNPAFIAQIQTTQKVAAITFDDGPDPIYTTMLLKLLETYNAKATFYTIGQQLEKHREIAVATHEAGHELGNHTYSHPYMSELDSDQQLTEIEQTEELLIDITGSKPATFRPPYLSYNDEVINLVESYDYRIILATNLEAADWSQPGVDHILDKSREFVVPGSILLFHDSGGDRSQTIEAVEILLAEFTAQGFQFVTVSELLKLGSL